MSRAPWGLPDEQGRYAVWGLPNRHPTEEHPVSTYTPTPADVEWVRAIFTEGLGRTPRIDGADAAPHLILGIVRALLDAANEEPHAPRAAREISRARAALQILEEHRRQT